MEQKPQVRKEILNVSDIAPALGVTPSRVYQMIHAGELPSVKVGKHGVRIPARAFEEWLEGKNAEGRASLRPASLSLADVIAAHAGNAAPETGERPQALSVLEAFSKAALICAPLLGDDLARQAAAIHGIEMSFKNRP